MIFLSFLLAPSLINAQLLHVLISAVACSLELCVITFMVLIIAIVFGKVKIPFIMKAFTCESKYMFLLGSVLIQTLPLMAFLTWFKKMEKLCDTDWTSMNF